MNDCQCLVVGTCAAVFQTHFIVRVLCCVGNCNQRSVYHVGVVFS